MSEKAAKNNSDAAKRSSEISQAEADLEKAEIQLKKGPVLSEIDRLKNEEKAENAAPGSTAVLRATPATATRKRRPSDPQVADGAAEGRAGTLRKERGNDGDEGTARREWWRWRRSVARTGRWAMRRKAISYGGGQPLMKIFDPSLMEVRTLIGEPDSVALQEGTTATVYLDAYPDAVFKARFQSASPVATAALGSPDQEFRRGVSYRMPRSSPVA